LLAVQSTTQRQQSLLVGSVVGQIGHAGGASGMASLMKAVLEIEHREVPQTVALETPLPSLANGQQSVRPTVQTSPVTTLNLRNRPMAAVSSCSKDLVHHVILEAGAAVPTDGHISAPIGPAVAATVPTAAADWQIVRVGAASLDELLKKLSAASAETLFVAAARSRFSAADRFRTANVAASPAALAEKLSPAPREDAPWRRYNSDQLKQFKSQVIREALSAGHLPDEAWDPYKRDLEISANLRRFAASGVKAIYHGCDLADCEALARLLNEIRTADGPIRGILHGAGYGHPDRFEFKKPQKIDRAFRGKVVGAVNLMALTRPGPLEYFVAFGSLAGRFGGNGLTDYAAANDMLAKLVGWYRRQRSDCRAACLHWQTWADVGMSTKADDVGMVKNELKMAFLSPEEGCEHLHQELRAGLSEGEVLLTDGYFQVTSQAAAMEVARQIDALGRRVAVVKADVGEQDDVAAMMEHIEGQFGRLNIIVSNAATGGFRPLLATSVQNFEATMKTNVLALVHLVQCGLKLLQCGPGRGKVIALSSHGSHMALPMYGMIGGSKAALESLARHFALECGPKGINVNIVKAGLVDTDSTRKLPGSQQMFEATKQYRSMTGDRYLQAEDVADAVLFLASSLSDMIQGETLTHPNPQSRRGSQIDGRAVRVPDRLAPAVPVDRRQAPIAFDPGGNAVGQPAHAGREQGMAAQYASQGPLESLAIEPPGELQFRGKCGRIVGLVVAEIIVLERRERQGK
jgi:enoyl-[acyl-carrier protein] reductase III